MLVSVEGACMFSVLRQRNYALLWSASMVSGIGNYVLLAALPFFVYASSGSTLASAGTFVSEMIPMVVFPSIGGIYADRWSRKPVLAASDVVRGGVLVPLFAVHGTSTLWIVYVVGFLGASAAHFAGPFGSAAVPHLVEEADIPSANAAFSTAGYIAVLVGSPLGGLLLQHMGLPDVVVVDSMSFLFSAGLIATINTPLQAVGHTPEQESGADLSAWTDWVSGLKYIRDERWVQLIFAVMILVFLGNSGILVALAPFVRNVLAGSAQLYSWVLTMEGVGGIAASLVVGRVTRRYPPAPLLASSILALGALTLVIAAAASLAVTLTLVAMAGFAILIGMVSLNTMLQMWVPDELRGRLFGAFLTVSAVASLLGAVGAGLLTDAFGSRLTIGGSGGLDLIAGLVALVALVPAVLNQPRGAALL